MTCQELERFIHPYLDGEFQPEERLELEEHLRGCEACARAVHAEREVQAALRRAARHAVQGTRAPAALRAGIERGLRSEQRRGQAVLWVRASAAALVVATAGGVWVATRPDAHQPYVEDAARRHAKGLPYEIQANHEGVEGWFTGKLDHRVPVPRLPNTTLAGARLSNVKDRPAAYISYEAATAGGAPKRIGLFVFDDARGEVQAHEGAPEVQSSHGYNVALWREGEIVYELVSDLNEADIRRLLTEQQAGGATGVAAAPRMAPAAPSVPVQTVNHAP